ncbi:hypothetical protein ACFS07_20490 [Undibacterium arcticum]
MGHRARFGPAAGQCLRGGGAGRVLGSHLQHRRRRTLPRGQPRIHGQAVRCDRPQGFPPGFFDPSWFALRNFHGQWYEDSDRLQQLVPFRSESIDDFARQMADSVPFYIKLGGLFPSAVKKRIAALAAGNGGPLHWFAHNEGDRIAAFFGSRAAREKNAGWEGFKFERPSATPQRLNHGYDESKPRSALSLEDLRNAAGYRGGQCVASDIARGDWVTPQPWRCSCGHQFKASPNLVLMGGHWCPECTLNPTRYAELAKHSPFFNQVWAPDQALVQQ